MALDPTISEVDFKRSVMKYLIDGLSGISLFFKPLNSAPRDDTDAELSQWVVVLLGERRIDAVSSCYITFDIYSRKDDEGFEISRIVDSIVEIFIDEDATNGLKFIPLYNTSGTPWVEIGGILPIHKYSSRVMPGKDQTLLKSVTYEFKWGAK